MQSSVNLNRLSERRRKNFKKFAKLLPLKTNRCVATLILRDAQSKTRALRSRKTLTVTHSQHSLTRAHSPPHTRILSLTPWPAAFCEVKQKKRESRRKSEARSCLCKYTVKNNKEKFSFYTIQNKQNKTSCALSNESDSFFKNIISN